MEGLWEGQARETSEPLPAPKGTPGELFQVSPNPSCPRVVVQRGKPRQGSLINLFLVPNLRILLFLPVTSPEVTHRRLS